MTPVRENLHRFFRAARGAGVHVSPAESIDAMRAVAQVGFSDRVILRDTLLLYDGIAMLLGLLSGAPADTPHPADHANGPRALAGAAAAYSPYLAAIVDACAHSTSPPTLQQLLSHPCAP